MEPVAQKTVKNKGSKKLFDNPILEKLSRTHIAVPIAILTLAAVGLLYWGINNSLISILTAVVLFFVGVITFSLVEYLVHRYLFHMEPNSEFKEKVQYSVHGVHHEYPKDKDRLAMPPLMSAAISTILFFIFKLLMGNFVFGFLPGFLVGYCTYLGVHYVVHAYQPPKNFFKVLWVHHGIHHYKDHERAFGVSSPLWDYVFGTMPK
ncbi:sterol desaturase family protein [Fulvivirgaceae bacterium BMA10]|uniref:Sterol desaturase family protein n=1 Tax=Splendidivirga corallicola TaxID=3051826 RepID=A0ABT8KUN9_9BACT|nr:sterol desaturase family protein [Fulvivirgaceae bacterium BMA10]